MRRIADIDLLDDMALQAHMAMGSLWIVVLGSVAGVLGAVVLPHEELSPWWFVLLGAISMVALPVHELVHAVAFELASGFAAHIRFGFKSWMLYTTAVGTMLPKRRFCAVLLAPAVCVTSLLGIVPAMLGLPLLGWWLAVIHLAGCTGDLAYVRIIAHEPMATLIEDTERGIALFHDD